MRLIQLWGGWSGSEDVNIIRLQVIGEGKTQVSGTGQQQVQLTDPKTGAPAGTVYFTVGQKQGGIGGALAGVDLTPPPSPPPPQPPARRPAGTSRCFTCSANNSHLRCRFVQS